MGLLDDCELHYGTRDLYELLKVSKTCSEQAIKRAYRKLSLKVHPDRAADDEKETATIKFQILSKISKVLLEKEGRDLYDKERRILDDDEVLSEEYSWINYWSSMFNLSADDIRQFHEKYRGSAEESEDLKEIYKECEGDMDVLFEMQICSSIEDEPRFRKILETAITEGEVPGYDKFVNESKAKRTKRKKFFAKEAKEAEAARKANGLNGDDKSLEQMILKRQKTREKEADSFFSHLEEKYAKKPKATGARKRKPKKT
ncbi:dnaJ homolog subfamily C member 9 [Ciona intestinalis]